MVLSGGNEAAAISHINKIVLSETISVVVGTSTSCRF